MTPKLTTLDTLTEAQISAFRDHAGQAGDIVAALVCQYALTGWDADMLAMLDEQDRHNLDRLDAADREQARKRVVEWIQTAEWAAFDRARVSA